MILARTIAVFLLIAALVGTYLLGYRSGLQAGRETRAVDTLLLAQDAAPSAASPDVVSQADAHASIAREFLGLLDSGSWYALERWLVANQALLTPEHGGALISTVAGKVNKYDAVALRRVLRAYLDVLPNDNGALFLLSDLQQMGGMREAALETLFKILDYPLDRSVAEQARRQADQIINVTDIELRNRGALAEREAFWQHISQRVPASDRYRYEWALALAQLKRWDEARRVLAETGTSDIAQTSLDELRARIDSAEQGLQFQRDGGRMLSTAVTPQGLRLTLLVDTGANVTSLSSSALRAAAAQRLPEQARLRTASGIVSTGVYEVAELEIQGHRFTDLRVVELPAELPGLDGLLGLDVLHQLSVDPLAVQQAMQAR